VISGLVLAAGGGSRIGRPKATLLTGGERLVDRAVRVLHDGGVPAVTVVAGAAPLDGVDATVVDNPDWATGVGSSLRVGLAAMADDVDAVVVLLVDMPRVGPEAVRRLAEAFRGGADLAIATYGGTPGHPVLLGRAHWAGVAESAVGDVGARPYLRRHRVTEVPCDDTGDPVDVDTPDDARAVLGRESLGWR
jgi:nicotine blue oxidoreductase